MRRGATCILLLALSVLGWTMLLTQTSDVHAQSLPFQGQAQYTLEGTIDRVDADRDQLTVSAPSGRYTIDTSQSQVQLRNRTGETGDLVKGMHVRITGTLLSSNIVAADQVRVLSLNGPVRVTDPVGPAPNTDIDLRGTVDSVNVNQNSFVVHINTHTRTIFVNDNTLFHGGANRNPDEFPVHAGDRVTINGLLKNDGTVMASKINITETPAGIDNGINGDNSRSELLGHISAASNRYMSRDIKVRVSSDREVTVHVPHNVVIHRGGRGISVHELGKGDVVRVFGAYTGDNDFDADRIEVIRYGDDNS